MIVFGTRGGIVELGEADRFRCPACQAEAPGEAIVSYRYFHIWYLFCFLTQKKRLIRCRSCGALWEPEEQQALRERYPDDRIPFRPKNGAIVCLFLLSAILIGGFISDSAAVARTDEYLSSPQPGDIYLADLALVDGSGYGLEKIDSNGDPAYGSLLLRRVEGDKRFFFSSQRAVSSLSAARKSLADAAYDQNDLFVLTAGEILKLREGGVIIDARRPD